MTSLKGKIKLDPKETAVIVIDMQNGCCSPKGFAARVLKRDVKPIISMSKKMPTFLDDMRKKKAEVIWIRSDFQEKTVPKNIYESETLAHGDYPFPNLCKKGTFDYEYYKISPKNNEKEFEKTHVNAFHNKKFDLYLKKRKIKTLIFIGVWTSRCVFCTIVGAATRGYRCIILKDLTANAEQGHSEVKVVHTIIHGMLGFSLTSKELLQLF